MIIHELSRRECEDILSRSSLGRLGCALFDQPYIVPISFAFDGDEHCLYAFSTVGQKIEWMRQNPKICLEVDDVADTTHWTTVIVQGRYFEISQGLWHSAIRLRAERLLQERAGWWLPGAATVGSKPHTHAVLYRLSIATITGRRTARQRQAEAEALGA